MDKLRATLREILDESKPIKDRFDTIFPNGKPIIEGLGRAILTPILLVVYPKRYGVHNGITENAMRRLAIHPDFTTNETIGERYAAVNEIIKKIAIKNNISLWEMDWVWWNIVRGSTIWVVRAGSKGEQEKDALEKNVVTIAWNQLPDLSSVSNKQSLEQLYMKNYPNTRKRAVANMAGSIWRFVNEIKGGDLVFLPLLSQNSKTIAIGKVEGDYNYKELTSEIKHIRPVKWLVKNILKSEFDEDIIKQFQRPMTVYEIKGNEAIKKIKKVLNRYGISDINIDINDINPVEAEFKKETERAITLEDVSRQTYFPIDVIKEIEILLYEKKQIIFYGPPGTSKTYFAKVFAQYFAGNSDNIALIQFHPSYSYEDFIEGIKPNLSETGQAYGFSKQDGFFKKLVKKCNADPNSKYVLIIDEINRGNIAKIFGELIYLLEYRKEKVVLTYSPNESFSIPSNLYLTGTMNSADRSIAFVDYALRRRFYFKNFYPDTNVNVLREWFEDHPPNQINAENVIHMLEEINKVIVERLGREYQIGHSYLMKEDLDNNALRRIIDYAIISLLEQYFFGKKERLDELKEICNRTTIPV